MSPASRAAASAKAAALDAELLLSELDARAAAVDVDASPPDAVPLQTTDEMPVAALRQLVRTFGGELEVRIALPDGRRLRLG